MINVMVTPLQRIVGFHVSEKTYDLLDFNDQLILDLKIEGFNNLDIAALLGVRPKEIKYAMERIRRNLANSELRHHLEMRIYYKQTHGTFLDEGVLKDNFGFQSLLSEGNRVENA